MVFFKNDKVLGVGMDLEFSRRVPRSKDVFSEHIAKFGKLHDSQSVICDCNHAVLGATS